MVVAAGFLVGVSLGAMAGYCRGIVDDLVMRFTDMMLGFPLIILAMAVAAALGASLAHGIIALAAVWWPPYVRVCRALVLDLGSKEYVVASRAAGRRPAGILLRVILPNALAGAAGDGSNRYRPGDPEFRHPGLPRAGRAAAAAGMGRDGVHRRRP